MLKFSDLKVTRAPALGFVAVGLVWGAFAALVPALKGHVGLSDGGFGSVMLVATIGPLGAMWCAPLVSRWLGRRALVFCMLALALAWLMPGLAGTVVAFTFAMTLAGATTGLLDVIMNARVSELEATSRRPLMNLNHGIFSLAYAVAAIGAGVARDVGVAPFTVFCVISASVTVMSVFAVTDVAEDQSDLDGQAPKGALPWLVVSVAGLVTLIAFMSEQATEGWSALFLERHFDARPALGALGPAILGMTMAVGRLSGQMLTTRFTAIQLIQGGAILSALGLTLAAVSSSQTLAYAGFGLFGLGVSVIAPMALAWAGAMARDDTRELVISRMTLIAYSGFFVGPPVMGFISEWQGLRFSFAAMVIIVTTIPLILVPLLRRAS